MPEESKELNRCLGKFEIPIELIRQFPESILRTFLSDCIVVRCEMRYDTISLHYTAMCRHFDVCRAECVPPRYRIHFKAVDIGTEENPEYETQFDRVERLP